ncbi:MAG TPA: hypothetical protein VFC53_11420 [Dehalococcoidia bacterium]|nr:hypothetical protein [Dehalococcoidia bacterium]
MAWLLIGLTLGAWFAVLITCGFLERRDARREGGYLHPNIMAVWDLIKGDADIDAVELATIVAVVVSIFAVGFTLRFILY